MSITETENVISSNPPDLTDEIRFPAYIDTLFEQLTAKDVEQFYRSYQLWLLQRRMGTLQTEIAILQQAVVDNEELMQGVDISPITLANLAQLQAYGVNDIDLLDRMSERGEAWLDHTMQLLKYCEELDVIRSNYTQWCEHALDGAYNWISSITAEAEPETPTDHQTASSEVPAPTEATLQATNPEAQVTTEEELLQKLMSDEGDTEKMSALGHNFGKAHQEQATITEPIDAITTEYTDEAIVEEEVHITSVENNSEVGTSIADEDKIDMPVEKIGDEDTTLKSIPVIINADIEAVPVENTEVQEEISAEIPLTPREEDDTELTDKFPIFTSEQINEPIAVESEPLAQEEDRTDSGAAEISDAPLDASSIEEVQNSHPEQTSSRSVVALESKQGNKKSSLQKAQRKGFWWFLRKLLLSILRR